MGTTGIGTQNLSTTAAGDPLVLVVVDGITACTLVIDHFPFTVGRSKDRDLVMTEPTVSREHAQFVRETNEIYLVDQASKHGTYVNGEGVARRKLARNDRVEFGARDAAYVIFNPDQSSTSTGQQLLSEVATWRSATRAGSVEVDGELTGFMEAFSPDRFLCHALCRAVSRDEGEGDDNRPERPQVAGVVCLDYPNRMPSFFSYGVIKDIAAGAATLVENAALMKAENAGRYIRQELTIAADIQQRLMRMTAPEVPYADVQAVSHACKDIGGDFFDLVHTSNGLSLVVADVSGKGVAAAVVAATLQGMLYSQLARDSSLSEMIAAVNCFLFDKVSGQKFATLVVARLTPKGEMELINCGHVPPIIVSGNKARTVEEGNLPVGLISAAEFQSTRLQLSPGDRLLLVTDGVTESENGEGEFFGMERLVDCGPGGFAAIESAVTQFRACTPLYDDCTITEMTYRGS